MFTQCPKCDTVYRLSADVLRAAAGQVRCGRCSEVFNAVARLAEDSTAFHVRQPALVDNSTTANRAPSADAVPPVETSPGKHAAAPAADQTLVEFAAADEGDSASDASLEFTLQADELDRIFVETSPSIIQLLALPSAPPPVPAASASVAAAPSPAAALGPAAAASAIAVANRAAAPKMTTPVVAPTLAPTVALPTKKQPAMPGATTVQAAPVRPRATAQAPPLRRAADLPHAGPLVPEKVRMELLSSLTPTELPLLNATRRRLPSTVWVAAAVILTLLLSVQMAVTNRDWLAMHVPGSLASASPVNLSVYQLRQWGVTGDPSAKGTLRVRASILNSAVQLEPYPLLRLTLANRFGTRIGRREFEPIEYLGKAPVRMLEPGERVDATLDILDPGKDAEGFEIDVCLRGAGGKVDCAGDAATPGTPVASAAPGALSESLAQAR